MLQVVMGVEQQLPRVQLHEDAANRPNIRGLIPTQLQHNLWSSVLAGVDGGRMMLPRKHGIAEIDYLDIRLARSVVLRGTLVAFRLPELLPREKALPGILCRGNQDVLWLQVCVNHVDLAMQEVQGMQSLLGDCLHIFQAEPAIVIVFDVIIQAGSHWLHHQTEMLVVVDERVVQNARSVLPIWVSLRQFLQNMGLNFGIVGVPLHIACDFDGNLAILRPISRHAHSAKCPIPRQGLKLVPVVQDLPFGPFEVHNLLIHSAKGLFSVVRLR
mmetsp:Transcript_59492/g.132757  ORF Transcript_59492/g.132757 Transcript_59492/m.132757 type:complete len:271 (+) Transcript_59492:425-1237(+)